MLKNAVVITVLIASLLISMPIYAFAIEEGDKSKPETKSETTTKSDSTTTNPSDTSTSIGKPDVSPTPGETNDKNTVNQPTEPTNKQLPKCDGSFQDCTTRNGDTCKAGEKSHACECKDDNSDCPNNPNVVVTNPIIPAMTTPKPTTPDFQCHFNPNDKHCAPDSNGNCPPGFAHNQQGNCHPTGPCPTGFARHDDDETGTCFPGPHACPKNFHLDKQHKCIKTVIIVKHTGSSSSSSSSSSSHSLSSSCFNEIKIAWLGKIQRGENSRVDNIIDKCLNIK